jgi:hypothetical protein
MERFPDSAAPSPPVHPLASRPETPRGAWPFATLTLVRRDLDSRGATFANLGKVVAVTSRSWGLPPPVAF